MQEIKAQHIDGKISSIIDLEGYKMPSGAARALARALFEMGFDDAEAWSPQKSERMLGFPCWHVFSADAPHNWAYHLCSGLSLFRYELDLQMKRDYFQYERIEYIDPRLDTGSQDFKGGKRRGFGLAPCDAPEIYCMNNADQGHYAEHGWYTEPYSPSTVAFAKSTDGRPAHLIKRRGI